MDTFATVVGACLLFVLAVVAFSVIGALPTYYLWNWLMPVIFGLKTITLGQAWGINFLCAMLFKSSSSSK